MTVSGDGQHFMARISVGCVSVDTNDMGTLGSGYCLPSRRFPRDLKDGPDGSVIDVPGEETCLSQLICSAHHEDVNIANSPLRSQSYNGKPCRIACVTD